MERCPGTKFQRSPLVFKTITMRKRVEAKLQISLPQPVVQGWIPAQEMQSSSSQAIMQMVCPLQQAVLEHWVQKKET